MLGPKAARENVMKEVFRIVQIHLDFFEDDLTFFSYVVGIEFGTKHEIGDDVKSDGQMLVEHFGVITNLLFRSESVEHAADRNQFAGNSFRGAALGAFENHVLDEMREAVFFRDLAAGAVANPNADGDGTDVGHGLGDDHEAISENMLLDVTRFRGGSHS